MHLYNQNKSVQIAVKYSLHYSAIIFTYLIKVIAGDQIPVGQITTVSVPVLSNYPNYMYSN